VILDASAFLAFLQDEPGADVVEAAFARTVSMSAVNWSEVLQKTRRQGHPPEDILEDIRRTGLIPDVLEIVSFDVIDAVTTAQIFTATRRNGLSFADRACLALALRHGEPALTADGAWAGLDLPVEVRQIR